MSKKDKQNQAPAKEEARGEQGHRPAREAAPGAKAEEKESDPLLEELEALKDQTAQRRTNTCVWLPSTTTTASAPPERRNPSGPT